MKSIHMRRPSSPMVVAFIALFLAVSGTATAAKLITGRQIARSTITGKHVRDHSLSPADFRGSVAGAAGPQGAQGPQGLKGATGAKGDAGKDGKDGKDGAAANQGLKGEKGDPGAKGDAGKDGRNGTDGDDGADGKDGDDGRDGKDGDDGRDGKDGAAGAAGFNGVKIVQKPFTVPASSHGTNATATCAAPTAKVVGGGYFVEERLADFVQAYSTYPDSDSSWSVRLGNTGNAQGLSATVYALCVAG